MQPRYVNKIIQETKRYSKLMSPKDLHHGFDHSLRVRNYALQIAEAEKANVTIVEIASYLHDIGRGREKNQYHTKTSSQLAKTFLINLGFPKDQTQKIIHCIETHSRKPFHRKAPETIEAKVLYDADGLELIGAVGLLRTALSAQVQNKDWKHILKKALWRLKIKDDFLTLTGKKISQKRKNLITLFIHQLTSELQQTMEPPVEENP